MQQNLQAELDAYRANIDTLVRAYDFMGEQIMVALKNQYSQQRDAQMAHLDATADAEHEALEARYDAQQKYHDNYMKMLDAEEKAEIAKYQALIDAIDAEQEAEDEAKRIARDAAKIAELQAEVNRAKNAKFRAIAQKALEEEIAKQAEEARKRERAAQKEALKAEIDNIEEQYDEKRDLEKERMEQIKEQYDAEKKALDAALAAQRAAWSSHYNTLLSEENLQAEARRLLLEENNEEMIALLESYNPQWYNAGRSFGELFVEALGVQMDNVEALINQVASLAQNRLDWIKAQVAEMQSVSGVTASDVASSISSSSGGVATLSSILQGSGFSSTAVYYNQTLEFNQPIQSPSDVTYAVRKASQEAAYAL